jgi:hypothetical protein
VGDAYPHPDIPPLTPSDPDPAPISTAQNTTQALILPYVQQFRLIATAEASAVFSLTFPKVLSFTLTTTAEASAILTLPLVATAEASAILEIVPLILATAYASAVLSTDTEEQPFAYWKLDASPWIDSAGTRPLDALVATPILGSDGEPYTQFRTPIEGWPYQGDSSDGFLETTTDQEWTRTADGNGYYATWRLVFDVWLESLEQSNGDTLIRIPDELKIYVSSDNSEPSMRLLIPNGSGESQPIYDGYFARGGFGLPFPDQTWNRVDISWSAADFTTTVKVNGASSTPYTSNVIPVGNEARLRVSTDNFTPASGQLVRMREIKFYRSAITGGS